MHTLLIDMDSVICDLMTDWHNQYNKDYCDSLSVEKLKCWESEKYVKPECGTKIYDYLDQPGLFLVARKGKMRASWPIASDRRDHTPRPIRVAVGLAPTAHAGGGVESQMS